MHTAIHYRTTASRWSIALAAFVAFSGCGGSGDPNSAKNENGLAAEQESEDAAEDNAEDRELTVSGTLTSLNGENVDGLAVCALGDCDDINGDGEYSLSVSDRLFSGGDVLFTFDDGEFVSEAVAPNLPDDNATVDFERRGDRIVPILVAVDNGTEESNTENTDGDGDQQDAGNSGETVLVRGMLTSSDNASVDNVEVCALGDCDTTDNGEYFLEIPSGVFGGGDVLFTFQGDSLDTSAIARGLPGNDRDAVVDFSANGNSVTTVNVRTINNGDSNNDDDNNDVTSDIRDNSGNQWNDIEDHINDRPSS